MFLKDHSGCREETGEKTSDVTFAVVLMRAVSGLDQNESSKAGKKGRVRLCIHFKGESDNVC